jgi:hypothetical protein
MLLPRLYLRFSFYEYLLLEFDVIDYFFNSDFYSKILIWFISLKEFLWELSLKFNYYSIFSSNLTEFFLELENLYFTIS